MVNVPKISLAAARVNAGYSQREAAHLIGVCVATLQNYESGKTSPSWGVATRIEKVYRYPLDYIFLPSPLAYSEKRDGIETNASAFGDDPASRNNKDAS